MTQRIPVRVRRVVDGVLFDSETAEVIHHWDERFLIAEVRFVLGKTPEGRLFLVSITEGGILRPGPNIHVTPSDRLSSIGHLADVNAPDAALESLDVEVVTAVVSHKAVDTRDMETVLVRSKRFGWQALLRSPSGQFWMERRYGLLGWSKRVFRPVTQRRAIRWAVWNGISAFPERLPLLGISSPTD